MSTTVYAAVKARLVGSGVILEGRGHTERLIRVPAENRKMVLLHLGDYADEEWSCWPRQDTIARELELSERTVRRTLRSLEEDGLIHRQARHHRTGERRGWRTSDRFYLQEEAIRALPETTGHSGRKSLETTGHPDKTTGHTTTPNRPPVAAQDPSLEPLDDPTPAPPAPPTPLRGPKAAVDDGVWAALLTACELDETTATPSELGAWRKAAKGLRAAGATPADITERARAYRLWIPRAALTPTALERNWSTILASPAVRGAYGRVGAAPPVNDPVALAAGRGRTLAATDVTEDELATYCPWDPDEAAAFVAAFHVERARLAERSSA